MGTRKIGRYEIIKEILPPGGMGTVYLAFDPVFRRQVAVKVLPNQALQNPKLVERFQQEAWLIAGLQHPHIVPVHDSGAEGEQPYIVMSYMEGGTLAQQMDGEPMPVEKILKVIERVAAALEAAHHKKIIHRDVKPSNILFDQWGEVYLSDFGIAKVIEGLSNPQSLKTGTLGTPEYMSPEQALGGTELSAKSDIYSLGVVAFEMLTGQRPYQATTPGGLLVKQVTEPIPVLSRNQLTDLNLSGHVNRVLKRVLAHKPDERYSMPSDFARELEQALKTPQTPTTWGELVPQSILRPLRSRPSRRVWGIVLLLGTLVGLLSATADMVDRLPPWWRPTATLTASPTDVPTFTETATVMASVTSIIIPTDVATPSSTYTLEPPSQTATATVTKTPTTQPTRSRPTFTLAPLPTSTPTQMPGGGGGPVEPPTSTFAPP